MNKPKTPAKPRIVVYLEMPEMERAQKAALSAGHKNAHRWGTAVIKKNLPR